MALDNLTLDDVELDGVALDDISLGGRSAEMVSAAIWPWRPRK